ncbi:hypothetical protein P7G51_06150 [Enterococcus asini]|uniref:hypothetical protein n=1 Tax=Enterococcus asini TaxID=57732 RepID=UPI002892860D|nr:hypothetical protein [Enterococcus asini]MDT2756958.1 hypothetical protein [Enterococcus asini]
MKRLVYILSKHGTVKNYVENITSAPAHDGTLNVKMSFTNEIDKTLDLEEYAEDISNQLASQMSPELVGIEEVAE